MHRGVPHSIDPPARAQPVELFSSGCHACMLRQVSMADLLMEELLMPWPEVQQ